LKALERAAKGLTQLGQTLGAEHQQANGGDHRQFWQADTKKVH
jgi:hypothetical protein